MDKTFETYHLLEAKLKKRFMRKPQYKEAAQGFSELANRLGQKNDSAYAALCAMAVSRCEAAMNHSIEQAHHITQAAQYFLAAEACDRQELGETFESNIVDAVSCYEQAIEIYISAKRFAYSGTLYTELANALHALGKREYAVLYHFKAASLHTDVRGCVPRQWLLLGSQLSAKSPIGIIGALNSALKCQLELARFENAADTVVKIAEAVLKFHSSPGLRGGDIFHSAGQIANHGAYRSLVVDCEVTALFLYLLLTTKSPTEGAKLRPLFNRYANNKLRVGAPYMARELEILLKHLVYSLLDEDMDACFEAQSELSPLLEVHQKDILHQLFVAKGMVMSEWQ